MIQTVVDLELDLELDWALLIYLGALMVIDWVVKDFEMETSCCDCVNAYQEF